MQYNVGESWVTYAKGKKVSTENIDFIIKCNTEEEGGKKDK